MKLCFKQRVGVRGKRMTVDTFMTRNCIVAAWSCLPGGWPGCLGKAVAGQPGARTRSRASVEPVE